MSRAVLSLDRTCELAKLPKPVAEYRFHPTRRWRFDWAWPDVKVAVEIDGAVYVAGRHTRGAGVEADMEKLNEAACLGWTVLRVSTRHMQTGAVMDWIERVLDVAQVGMGGTPTWEAELCADCSARIAKVITG